MSKGQPKTLLYVLADTKLQDTDIGIGLGEILESFNIGHKFSESTFDNSLLWISAKDDISEFENIEEGREPELCLVYYNSGSFTKDYSSGKLHEDMQILKAFFSDKGIKVIVVFQSVGDTLYNNLQVTRQKYDEFLIELTAAYEFDYIELKTIDEWFKLFRDVHECLEKKSGRKELLMGDMYVASKGAKQSKKATLEGFDDEISKYWIWTLMSIPEVSESKAIAIAKEYPTFKSLADKFAKTDKSHAEKKKTLNTIEVPSSSGDGKMQKIGNKVAERVYETLSSTDPDLQIG